jgi:hypothetical protein
MAMGGKLRPGFQHVDRADVGKRKHPTGELRRPGDVAQSCMRHLTAHEGHVLHTGYMDIGNEHAMSVEMTRILLAQHAGTDPTFGICLVRHALCPLVPPESPFTPIAAERIRRWSVRIRWCRAHSPRSAWSRRRIA